jgi:hypothetical protein
MKTLSARLAALGVAATLLCSGTAAFAVTAPAVGHEGWNTLEGMMRDAEKSAITQGSWLHQAAAMIYSTRVRNVITKRVLTKRELDANVVARMIIRGKEKEAERVSAIINAEREKYEEMRASAVTGSDNAVNRERLVKADAAKLPNKCSNLHTHDRAVCLNEIALAKRVAPAVIQVAGTPAHAAARAR